MKRPRPVAASGVGRSRHQARTMAQMITRTITVDVTGTWMDGGPSPLSHASGGEAVCRAFSTVSTCARARTRRTSARSHVPDPTMNHRRMPVPAGPPFGDTRILALIRRKRDPGSEPIPSPTGGEGCHVTVACSSWPDRAGALVREPAPAEAVDHLRDPPRASQGRQARSPLLLDHALAAAQEGAAHRLAETHHDPAQHPHRLARGGATDGLSLRER